MEKTKKLNPKFMIGQIIHHKKYNYRGVIAAWDKECLADEDWYNKNKTSPDRNQPWYHILVDDGGSTTYVAQENLKLHDNKSAVSHVLLDKVFAYFYKGRYFIREQ